jgi:hypothetical protein
MQRAILLIQRVCDMTAPRDYLADTREYLVNAGIVAAVAIITPGPCIVG